MLSQEDIRSLYFIGIGGIGMSALARYYHRHGYRVAGYDRTPSPLTHALQQEGIRVVYDDSQAIEQEIKTLSNEWDKRHTLVVRTPAVPADETIYQWLRQEGYTIVKRAELLGQISRRSITTADGKSQRVKALCVAGTHGKTTTTTLLAHIWHESGLGCNAFLGGISENYHSNLITDTQSQWMVAEADEYDRSFHHLTPYMTVITSIEPDHLDIYGTAEEYQKSFDHYASLAQEAIVLKKGFTIHGKHCKTYTYSIEEKADFYSDNIHFANGNIIFDLHTPTQYMPSLEMQLPIRVNVENATAAVAIAMLNGINETVIRKALYTFQGVKRRFNRLVNNEKIVYIDDYAHHPTEISTAISCVRQAYPRHLLVVVFQPHLFTRTRDFADDFAQALSKADKTILLPIYPARELPIEGVTSEALAQKFHSPVQVVQKGQIVSLVADMLRTNEHPTVVMTLGAGDIDRIVPQMQETLNQI